MLSPILCHMKGAICVNYVTKAELFALEKLFQPGSRVELEYMEQDPYSDLVPGDLGTVIKVDDLGQIHVSWDKGGCLGIAYKIDKCRCVMTKDKADEIIIGLKSRVFDGIESLKNQIEDDFLSAFPNMFFRKPVNNELLVELGTKAFKTEIPKIQVKFSEDQNNKIIVEQAVIGESIIRMISEGQRSKPK